MYIDELIQDLKSGDLEKRYDACKRLQSMEEIPTEAINALINASADPEPLISITAIEALNKHKVESKDPPIDNNPNQKTKSAMIVLEWTPIKRDKFWHVSVLSKGLSLVFKNPIVWLLSLWIVLFRDLPSYLSADNLAIDCVQILTIPITIIAEAALIVVIYYSSLGGFIKFSLSLRRGIKTLGRLILVYILTGLIYFVPSLFNFFITRNLLSEVSLLQVSWVYIPLIFSIFLPIVAFTIRSIVINDESFLFSLKISLSMYGWNFIPVIVFPIIFIFLRVITFGFAATVVSGFSDFPGSMFAQLNYNEMMNIYAIPSAIFLMSLFEFILIPIESSAYTIAFLDLSDPKTIKATIKSNHTA